MSSVLGPGESGEYCLMRQDDNGNRYAVAYFPDRDAAEKARAEFEARGHKQIYWVQDVQRPSGA